MKLNSIIDVELNLFIVISDDELHNFYSLKKGAVKKCTDTIKQIKFALLYEQISLLYVSITPSCKGDYSPLCFVCSALFFYSLVS